MSRRRCRVLVVFSAMVCSPVHAQDIPRGEAAFTEYVATQLRRETGGAAIVVKGQLTLAVGELQANLDRIFAYCSRDRTGCAREISTYVKGVAQIHKDPFAPPSKEAVRVLVRTQAYVTMSQAALRKEAPKLQPRELAGGLVMLPAIDMPRSLQMLTDEDNRALGLSVDEVFKLGFANLRARLKPLMEVAKVVRPGQIGHLSGDVYHPSRLALRESWSPLAKAHGGKLIVAVPTTDTVLYVGDDTPTAIGALRALAKNVWIRSPNQLSTELLRWTPKRWEVVY
jgi:uncharacterized protein YtpQ (UPF0354 family)